MTDVTRVLFMADNVRDMPQYGCGVVRGSEPTLTTKLSEGQRLRMIAHLCTAVRDMCARPDGVGHICVSTEILPCAGAVHVTVVYGRECLYTTAHVQTYLETATNIVHEARLATVRDATQC